MMTAVNSFLKPSRVFPKLLRILFRQAASNCNLYYLAFIFKVIVFEVNRKTSFDCFLDVMDNFFLGFALRNTTGNRRNFCPIAAFFCFMNYYFEFHFNSLLVWDKYRERCVGFQLTKLYTDLHFKVLATLKVVNVKLCS